MAGNKAIPLGIAFTMFAGLAMPAVAQTQTRDRDQRPTQERPLLGGARDSQKAAEMKGPIADAVGHLKDAYSEIAKSHASLVAGKYDDAKKSIHSATKKLDDAMNVRNVPNDDKTMNGSMKKRLADLDASIARGDQQAAANAANRTVRDMGQNMNHLLATHGPITGGGGGPRDKQQIKQRGGGGGAEDRDRMEQEQEEQQKQEQQKKEE